MRLTGIRHLILIALTVFGMFSTAWATTWTVPAATGIAATDTTNINTTISRAKAGDTIAFAAAGNYAVNAAITLANSLTYTGNGCTITWSPTTNGYILATNAGATTISISGFSLNGNGSGGGVYIADGSSNITVTHNTIYNDLSSGWNDSALLVAQGAFNNNIQITFNTFHDIGATNATGDELDEYANAIGAYDLNDNSAITDNTCYNIRGDFVHTLAQQPTADSGVSYLRNTAVTNMSRNGLELQNQGGAQSNLDIENNTFTVTAVNGSSCLMGLSGLSIANSVIKNNTLTAYWAGMYGVGIEFCTGVDVNLSTTITNNYISADNGLYFSNRDNNHCSDNLLTDCGQPIFDNYYANSATTAIPENTFQNDIIVRALAPTVTVTAGTPNGTTSPYVPGAFTFSRGSATSGNLQVNYTMSGTATNGTDYSTLSGSALIPDGASSTVVNVDPLNSGKSGAYTVVATLAFGGYYIGATAAATVNLTYNGTASGIPTYVTIVPATSSVTQGGSTGAYTITRSGDLTSALTVNYTMSGTATAGVDYTVSPPGSVTIPANSASATITLTPVNNTVVDGVTSAMATLVSGSGYSVGYPNSATMNIVDTDIPTANLQLFLHADAGVTSNSGTVTTWADYSGQHNDAMNRVGEPEPTYVTNDVNGLPALRFAGGSTHQSLQFPVEPGFYNFDNGASVFLVTYPNGGAYWTSALEIANISDYDGLQFGPSYANKGDNTNFQLGTSTYAQSGIASVSTTNGGMTQQKWQLLEGTIDSAGNIVLYKNGTQLASGNNGFPLRHTIRANSYLGDAYNTSNASYGGDIAELLVYGAALSSADRQTVERYLTEKYFTATPTVTISAAPTSINEANGTSTYTFARTGSTASSLTVYYTLQGSAVNGTDYTLSDTTGSCTIPSGADTGTVTLTTIDRDLVSGSKTATLSLATNASYLVGSPYTASVTILDNDPGVIVTAFSPCIDEDGGTDTFTINRGDTANAVTVYYAMSGTATNGTDYADLTGSLTFPNGSATGTVTLTPRDRGLTTGSVTATLTILPNTAYIVGTPASATVTINDNDGGGSKIDDTNAIISYSGFTVNDDPSDYEGTEHDAASTNAFAQVTFHSTQALVIGKTGPNYGKGDVYLDGTMVGAFDGYTAGSGKGDDQQPLFMLGGLPSGSHTVKIVVSGTKDAQATGYTVALDAFDFTPPSLPTVTVTAAPTSINETGGHSTYTVTRTGNTTDGLTVHYTLTGTAVNGTDYGALADTLTITSGAATGTVTLTALDRALSAGSCTATLTLAANAGYLVGAANAATVTLHDNDAALTAVTLTTPGFSTPMTQVNVPPGGITLQATPTGGSAVEYQFAYALYNANSGTFGAFVSLNAYSTAPICKWMPSQTGAYALEVLAREHGADSPVSDCVGFTILPSATLKAVTVSTPGTPSPLNLSDVPANGVTIQAVPTGGTNVEYLYGTCRYDAISKSWSAFVPLGQGQYTTRTTCQWTPTQSGTYALQALAREHGATVAYQVYGTQELIIAAADLAGVTLQTDAAHPSPQPVNTAITLTAVPTGTATAEYNFVYSVYNPLTRSWGPYQPIAGGYQNKTTCVWTPTRAGNYAVAVEARMQGSSLLFDVSDIKGYVITP